MSEEQSADAKEKKPLSPQARTIIFGAIVLVLLVIVWLGGHVRGQSLQAEERRESVEALGAAFADDMITGNRVKTERELAKVAEKGGYSLIVLADVDGKIFAASDERTGEVKRKGQPEKTLIVGTEDGEMVETPIMLAEGNPIGRIQVVFDR